jgi:hypothetical protein
MFGVWTLTPSWLIKKIIIIILLFLYLFLIIQEGVRGPTPNIIIYPGVV